MNIKLAIAQFIRWHELKLAWKVFGRQYVLQHNLFAQQWENFEREFGPEQQRQFMEGMDKNSQDLVKLLIHRFSNPFIAHPALYPKTVFTTEEIRDQEEFRTTKQRLATQYHVPQADVDPAPLMYQSGLRFLPPAVHNSIKASCVLDIGAFMGQASMVFLDFQPDKVFSFEPSRKNFSKLSKYLSIPIKNGKLVPVNCAMGNEKGFAMLNEDGNASSIDNSTVTESGFQVPINTVDDFIREHPGISRVGLMKLDVEGFETNVIKGALQTIKTHKPVLLISIYHNPTDFFNIKPLLEDLGTDYSFMVRKTNPFWLTYDTMLICYPKSLAYGS
jgi:FkbM family methyltransferase